MVRHMHVTTTHAILDDIEDGAELYRAVMDPGVNVQVRPSIEVTFAVAGPGMAKPVLITLAQLIEHVEIGVIPKFGLHKRKPRAPKWKRPA
jgi:hypothetical protein